MNGNDWRKSLERLRALRRDLDENYRDMTPYERRRADAAIADELARQRGGVVAGMREEWNAALKDYQNADKWFKDCLQQESKRWDLTRVTQEMTLARIALERSPSITDAEKEYQKAMDGDTNRQRAWAEVFSVGLENRFPNDRLRAHGLSVDAARHAEELQQTDDLRKALVKGDAVVKNVVQLQQEIQHAAREVDAESDMYRELNRVTVQRHYNDERGGQETTIRVVEPQAVTPQATNASVGVQTYSRLNTELRG